MTTPQPATNTEPVTQATSEPVTKATRPPAPAPLEPEPGLELVPKRGPGPGLVKPLTIHFQPLPTDPTNGERLDLQVSPELIAYHQAEHVVSGQYRRLAEQLRAQLGQGEPRALVLCGANRSAGTTTVTLNLAITLARAGERVAVLDANVQRPAVAAKLGLASTPGLAEVLTRRAPLPWALRAGPVAGLHVLACPSSFDLDDQATARLAAVVDGLRARHDWVIVDAGVMGQAQVLAVLTACCEATYLVLRQEDIDLPELASVQSQIEASGGQLRGYVLTQG